MSLRAVPSSPLPPEPVTSRAQRLQQLVGRLRRLLSQEARYESPEVQREKLRWLEEKLIEAGLVHDLRTEGWAEFVADLQSALEVLDPGVMTYPVQPLRTFENSEELILGILPTDPGW